jgi:hypothetical protein
MDSIKSRDIPIGDLFHNLQLEWISYYIRSKIYERECDIKAFNDICGKKKDKIDTFSLRNSIASIFSKEEKMKKFINEFYPLEKNLPNFCYTPKNRNWLFRWDKNYFYCYNTIVNFEGELVTILKNDNLSDEVEFLTSKRVFRRVPYNQVRKDIMILF